MLAPNVTTRQHPNLDKIRKDLAEYTLGPSDVAYASGVTEHGVCAAIRRGDLPAIKVGGRWKLRESDVRTWLGLS